MRIPRVLGTLLGLWVAGAAAGVAAEEAGVATLPEFGSHWLWVPDRLLEHNMLFDGDSGEVVGMIDTPSIITPKTPLLSRARGEIYSVDIAYSRGKRGARVDFVTIHDPRTLSVLGEIVVPTQSGSSNTSWGYAELIGERFLGIYNQFPVASISIVDLERRAFVEEIPIAGCAGVYPIAALRVATLCGDGSALLIELHADGRKARSVHSERFFETAEDPMFMPAGRDGARWTFVSFEGRVQTVDFSGAAPSLGEAWSLFGAGGSGGWRPGGLQHVALHVASKRLYVVMHEGGPGSHKDPGNEVWVYDLVARERVERFTAPNLVAAFLGSMAGVEADSMTQGFLDWIVPFPGVATIAVTQDEAPLLFLRSGDLGAAIGVMDARTGETLRILSETGLTGPTLRVP